MEKQLSDRQLEALLARLDDMTRELSRLNDRLERQEGFVLLASELRTLNESLTAIAYAALGQAGPNVRRRRTG